MPLLKAALRAPTPPFLKKDAAGDVIDAWMNVVQPAPPAMHAEYSLWFTAVVLALVFCVRRGGRTCSTRQAAEDAAVVAAARAAQPANQVWRHANVPSIRQRSTGGLIAHANAMRATNMVAADAAHPLWVGQRLTQQQAMQHMLLIFAAAVGAGAADAMRCPKLGVVLCWLTSAPFSITWDRTAANVTHDITNAVQCHYCCCEARARPHGPAVCSAT
jgi:hypothetical protein